MTHQEKKKILEELGLSAGTAEWYLKYESDTWAVLPVFRLLKPLNDDLVFHQGGYRKLIERYKEEGKLAERMPEEARLIESGASPEDIEKCGYWRLMEMSQDGEPTGRYLREVHGLLPFSCLE